MLIITGKKFGITDFINPDDYKIPIEEVIMDMTTGGLDYAFECCGIPSCMVNNKLKLIC
jgi:S-(hydroxymethyl)glutathione dehydrogenase/alcohol dehydrogenase